MKLFKIAVLSVLMVASSAVLAATPRGYNLTPLSNKLLVASAGEVILTFLSKTAFYSSDLYLQESEEAILNNKTAISGSQFSLGTFEAGSELSFSLFVKNTGMAYYTGVVSQNPDGFLHAAYDVTSKQSLNVGFEDMFGGGDKDYDDLVFSLSNVMVSTTPVPEPEVNAMLLIGSLMLGAVSMKRRK